MPENVEVSSITLEELETLLSKYFKTLEQIDLENQQALEEQERLSALEQQELEESQTSSLEFQQELLQEIKTLQEYSKFGNNMFYFNMVAVGLILIYVLFYKFLKIFI